jgi:hypothetical protein
MSATKPIDERIAQYLKANPQVAAAIESWARPSMPYEEALKPFLLMPVSYSGTSSVTAPPSTPSRDRGMKIGCRQRRSVKF